MVCQLLIIADSRGTYLQRQIGSQQIKVLHFPGAPLLKIIQNSYNTVMKLKPKYLLILGGIFDVTSRHRGSTQLSIGRYSDEELFSKVYHSFLHANDLAHQNFPNTKIIFGDLCGMDLNRYNHRNGYHGQQAILDDVIHRVNLMLQDLNLSNGVPHPRLTKRVHQVANANGGLYQNHYRFLIDGLHAGPILLADWAMHIRKLFYCLTGYQATTMWR